MSGVTRRILPYLDAHRRTLAWAFVQVLLISGCELLKPWPLKVVIDTVLGGRPLPWGSVSGWSSSTLLLAACVTLVLIYAVLGALTVLNNHTTIRVGQRMVNELRSDLYGHLHRLSLAFHGRARIGDLLYRVTADTLALQTLTMNCLFPAVTALTLLTGMSVIMLRLDAALTLLALAVCPVLFVAIGRLTARITRAAAHVREGESEVYAVVQRAMSAMRVVQAFTREEDEHRRFMTASRQSLAAGLRLYTLQTFYSGVVNVVIAVGTAAVVWMGARHVMDGSLSVGSLMVFVSYLASLYGPINSMFQTWGLAQGSTVGLRRVFDLLDVERDIADGGRDFQPQGARGEVAWEAVAFEYTRGRPVLDGVSLRVEPGQTVAIVGATGAGKSTLLSLLPRFYDATAGRVLVDGVDVRDYRLASLRRQIAMVLQPPLVLPTTLRDNIAFGRPGAGADEIVAAARMAGIHDAIVTLPDGYDTVVGEGGVTLSEGEKQRITIARAIVRDAPILILDEPTSSLDVETEALIMQGLERLTAGRTTFVIAHRLSTVRQADLIVVLRDGRIVEHGRFDALVERRGVFAALYRLGTGPRPEDTVAIR
ncbi:MAG: ABC transporter ATP-binding protein [Candidatus Rokuibacteriota bacterium]|nr:MAG: ABC transporter ATP-binding protein [Candidatus Rokubacteria bacterium]